MGSLCASAHADVGSAAAAKRLPRVITYAIVVNPTTGVTAEDVRPIVAAALIDPRSWQPIKRVRFVETDSATARLRIRILPPSLVDALCDPLPTEGYRSCSRDWNVYLNADRWNVGAPASHMDLASYRTYLINHEVGHSLGEHHRPCPGNGRVAPVMLQQTIGLDGCVPNPWPNPNVIPPTATSTFTSTSTSTTTETTPTTSTTAVTTPTTSTTAVTTSTASTTTVATSTTLMPSTTSTARTT